MYSKMYQSLELPQRIVLKPNLHYGRQYTFNFEARAPVDHLSREYGETRSGREYGETLCWGRATAGKKALINGCQKRQKIINGQIAPNPKA